MRICFVSHSNAHFTRPYVDYFANAGCEVHLISAPRDDLPNAINHHPLDREFNPRKERLSYFWMHRSVRRMIREIDPDVLHAHYLSSNGLMAALTGFHPLVVTAHGSDVFDYSRSRLRRTLIRFVMRRADLVNPVSRELEQSIRDLGVPQNKIFRATFGIDIDRFETQRPAQRSGPVRLICTRNLRPVYQNDRIIPALAMLRDRDVEFEFTFAADGECENDLRSAIKQAGLDRQVRFLGGFTQDELPALLAGAEVYVSASAWDGTSICLLEAMASGLFPVVSAISSNSAWLDGARDALFFDPLHAEQLADCLQRAIEDTALRQGAVAALRDRVRAEGDRNTNMRQLFAHYKRLCN